MSTIAFRQGAPNEWRILQDNEHVGDVYRHRDILDPAASLFVIHLDEDPRGFVRVHDPARVRQIVRDRLETHPLWT